MAGQGIDEIQRLKAAEQMALEQVSDAREYRKQKMRQAVTDADTSIKQYEATLEAELDSRHAPGSLDQAKIDASKKQTDAEIQQLKLEFASNKDAGMEILLAASTTTFE